MQISYSLKNILARVDRGEGLIGELTSTPETKQRITDTLLATLNKTNAILSHVESGKGLVGKLVYDDKYSDQLTMSLAGTAESLRAIVTNLQKSLESGQGALPALLNDPEGKKRLYELVDNLRVTSANLAAFTASMQTGQGLVPRLLNDKAAGDQVIGEFTGLVHQLNEAVTKLNSGQGSAGNLISDPSVYESINDILIGINESKLLRWLIRNRQQKGIEKRVQTQQKQPPPPPTPPPAETAPASVPLSSNGTTQTTSTSPPPKPYVASPSPLAEDPTRTACYDFAARPPGRAQSATWEASWISQSSERATSAWLPAQASPTSATMSSASTSMQKKIDALKQGKIPDLRARPRQDRQPQRQRRTPAVLHRSSGSDPIEPRDLHRGRNAAETGRLRRSALRRRSRAHDRQVHERSEARDHEVDRSDRHRPDDRENSRRVGK